MAGHIFIYGGIGTGPGEVSINNVKSQLDDNKPEKDLVLHMVTTGGDVFEGYGIYNILRNSGKNITTHVEGLCASIGTLIGWAGDKVIMNRTAEWMVHNPKISDLKGEASDLRNAADQLDMIKNLLIDVAYARSIRNGRPVTKEKLWQLYDNETWLTAQDALSMGFVDEVQDAIKAVAKVDLTNFKMESKYKELATRFKNFVGLTKIKNEFTETLQDGTIIIVMSEDEDWTGKQVVYEDGSPLPDGDHTLASGKVISVAGGVISSVKEGSAENNENEEMDNKIKELEAQLAEAQAAKTAAEASAKALEAKATTAEAKATRFENRATLIEKEFISLKEEFTKTVGDTSNVEVDTRIRNGSNTDAKRDPMGDMALDFYRKRNLVK